MSKNFESFREFLDSLYFRFSAIRLSETWCQPDETSNSNRQILGQIHGLIPTLNKRTRVTRNTATAIDHIITNSVINAEFKTGIINTDISDHFPIFFIFKCVVDSTEAREELYIQTKLLL